MNRLRISDDIPCLNSDYITVNNQHFIEKLHFTSADLRVYIQETANLSSKEGQLTIWELPMPQDIDNLTRLNNKLPIAEKILVIHNEINRHIPFIHRIAVAIYEEERDLLKTFLCSCDDNNALPHYQSRLSDSPSLKLIAKEGHPRIVNDLGEFFDTDKEHSKKIASYGYGSSYTYPIYNDGVFIGFIFINSFEQNAFTPQAINTLSPFIHLIGLITIRELELIKVLIGSVCTALDITHHRDPETGAHLERMSRYSLLIANTLAASHELDDEYVEYLYRFAPLHDVGKIAIPDSILLKQGKLTADEFTLMKTHTVRGREIIERMIQNFQLHNLKHTEMLKNIIESHHESLDGSGYPNQLQGEAIPLEARIIAVADIFDALTSARPYKKPWSNADAFSELRQLSGNKLDAACVGALCSKPGEVEAIQAQFSDDPFG